RNSRFVRQRAPGSDQFLLGSVVILIRPIKMLSNGEMCLPRFRTQAASRLKGCFGQLKSRVGVIETEEINSVMCSDELTIGIEEQRIACDSLIKQLRGLDQIFFCPGTKRNAID